MRRSESVVLAAIAVLMVAGLVLFIASTANAATIDFRSGGPPISG